MILFEVARSLRKSREELERDFPVFRDPLGVYARLVG